MKKGPGLPSPCAYRLSTARLLRDLLPCGFADERPRIDAVAVQDGFVDNAVFLNLIARGVALALLLFLHVRIGGSGRQDSRPPLSWCTGRYHVAGRVRCQALVQLALIYNAVSLCVAMAVALPLWE